MDQLPPQDPAGGAFGHWQHDAHGQPVFVYTIDHTRDPRAAYRTSLGDSRDHWHQVGTGNFIATVHSGGYTQLYDAAHGLRLLNRWHPAATQFGGGFLLITCGGLSFSTLWEGLPPNATQERRWGCHYAERITRLPGLDIIERLEGVGGRLCQSFTLHNTGNQPLTLTLAMPWWLNPHPITPAPLLTLGLRRWIDVRRARHLRGRHLRVTPLDHHGLPGLLATIAPTSPPGRDRLAGAALALQSNFGTLVAHTAAHLRCDAATGLPLALDQSPQASADFPADAGLILAAHHTVHLEPGASAHGELFLQPRDPREALPAPPAPEVLTLEVPGHAPLARELHWHSAYLQGGTYYSGYHHARFVDQGSAYAYLQGLSGAPRDFALFILPMVYLNPPLAKDMLRHFFACQHHRSGKLPYANVNHGQQRGYVLHSFSSDLDLFLLWATAEYLGATQDHAFLAEQIPYYPSARRCTGTVLDHLQRTFAHLRDHVGLGPHGLLRCGSGDWNDVLLGFSRIPPLTLWRGESSLNAGLAALALPRLADALGDTAPDFSADLRAYGEAQAAALKSLWAGRWAARGYLGYGNKVLGADRLFLDTQAFGVLAGVWDDAQRATLFENIDALCVRPQKVGALALWPPMKGPMLVEGSDTNGGTWAAIDGLLAWAWAQHDPQRAWAFYQSTTLAARAEAYPEVWYGVWSGPDSFNAHYHPRPGETFCHNFTPMADFPVMNMNRHALPLLDAIKFAGITPRDGLLEIAPRVPGHTFTFRSALITLEATPTTLRATYHPVAPGKFTFRVAIPPALHGKPVHCNAPHNTRDGDHLTFTLSTPDNTPITWQLHCD